MKMSYSNIDFSDLRGDQIADYLVAVDADFRIGEGGRMIYEEPGFPVVELARSFSHWLRVGGSSGFEFVSLSADEPGIVTISPEGGGWCIYSSFTPEVRSSVVQWTAVEGCIREFINSVRCDLERRGFDADRILGEDFSPHDFPNRDLSSDPPGRLDDST